MTPPASPRDADATAEAACDRKLANALIPLLRENPGVLAILARELLGLDLEADEVEVDYADIERTETNSLEIIGRYGELVSSGRSSQIPTPNRTPIDDSPPNPPAAASSHQRSISFSGLPSFVSGSGIGAPPGLSLPPRPGSSVGLSERPVQPRSVSPVPEMQSTVTLMTDWDDSELGLVPTVDESSKIGTSITKAVNAVHELQETIAVIPEPEPTDTSLRSFTPTALDPDAKEFESGWIDERFRQEAEDEAMARELQKLIDEETEGHPGGDGTSAGSEQASWTQAESLISSTFASSVTQMDVACRKMLVACSAYRNAAVVGSSSGRQRASKDFQDAWRAFASIAQNPFPGSGLAFPIRTASRDKYGILGLITRGLFELELPDLYDDFTTEELGLIARLFSANYSALRRILLTPLAPDLHVVLGLRTAGGLPSKRAFQPIFGRYTLGASQSFMDSLRNYFYPLSDAVQGIVVCPLLAMAASPAMRRRLAEDPIVPDALSSLAIDVLRSSEFMNPSKIEQFVAPHLYLLESIARADSASFRARIGSPDRAQRALHTGPKSLPEILKDYKERSEKQGREDLGEIYEQGTGYLEIVTEVWKPSKTRPTPKVPLGPNPCDNCGRNINGGPVKCSCGWAYYCSDGCFVEARPAHVKDHGVGETK